MQRLLPPFLLIITWAAMIAAAILWSGESLIPTPLRWIAGIAALAGLLVSIQGARAFKRVGTNIKTFNQPHKLVTNGMFAWSRNPMYLGFAICALAGAVALGSLAALAIAAVFCVVVDLWYIRFEEAVMRKAFGQDYDAYCARVRRWL